jgi:hypothetical protein
VNEYQDGDGTIDVLRYPDIDVQAIFVLAAMTGAHHGIQA